MRLVFATNNAHKLDEVRRILPQAIEVLSLRDIGFEANIVEDGDTLEANSRIKAEQVYAWLQEHGDRMEHIDGVFADDTGLEIAALGGQPGVYTARWAGEPANDANNRAKALRELQGKDDRSARFRTVVTLRMKGREAMQMDGEVRGRMAMHEQGDHGFGYDPLFMPEGYDKTFAQLPAEVKNTISHRANAMAKLKAKLEQI